MAYGDERELFGEYSQGRLTRRDLESRLGRQVLFGDALLKLYEFGLPLPRTRPDLDTPGARLLREVLRRPRHG